MKIEYYTITARYENGEIIETRRHTKEGMETCVTQYENARDVVKISVYEHCDLLREPTRLFTQGVA